MATHEVARNEFTSHTRRASCRPLAIHSLVVLTTRHRLRHDGTPMRANVSLPGHVPELRKASSVVSISLPSCTRDPGHCRTRSIRKRSRPALCGSAENGPMNVVALIVSCYGAICRPLRMSDKKELTLGLRVRPRRRRNWKKLSVMSSACSERVELP